MKQAIRRSVIAGISGVLLATVAVRAEGQSAAPSAIAGAPADVEEDWSTWIGTLEESAQNLRSLRKVTGELQAEVARMNIRRYPRGEEKERLLAAFERAQTQLGEAEANHPELLEQARQAGVPQGMLQDFEDVPAAAP
jgi:hypothetical protein